MSSADNAHQFASSRSTAAICRSPRGAAGRCWWSTPHPSAATRRNIRGSRRCGAAIATAASSSSAFRPTISARRSRAARPRSNPSAPPITRCRSRDAQVPVTGREAHPFYRWLAGELGERGAALEFPQIPDRPRRRAGRRLAVLSPPATDITGEIDKLLPPAAAS